MTRDTTDDSLNEVEEEEEKQAQPGGGAGTQSEKRGIPPHSTRKSRRIRKRKSARSARDLTAATLSAHLKPAGKSAGKRQAEVAPDLPRHAFSGVHPVKIPGIIDLGGTVPPPARFP